MGTNDDMNKGNSSVSDKNNLSTAEENINLTDVTKLLDKDIFFSAGAAYKKTQVAQKKKIEAGMLPVYSKINEAINNGEYNIQLWLNKEQRDFLYNKNFRLSSLRSENNQILYKISWG